MASDPDAADLIPLSPRDFLILTVMASGPIHGYGIMTSAEERFGTAVPLDPANLYRSLKRLMRDGVVVEAEANDADGRRVYALTGLGRRVLDLETTRLRRLTAAAELSLDEAGGGVPEPA